MHSDTDQNAASPAIRVHAGRGGPVLLSVPHSGRDYSPGLLADARHGAASLAPLEDPWVDRLVQGAIDRGAGAIVALAPRALIDVNRDPTDIDPTLVLGRSGGPASPRARSGLGLIPTRLSGLGNIWRGKLTDDEVERRLATVHRPYHEALSASLAALRRHHDDVVLIDCHSMPPRPHGEAQVIIGDRFGTSAAPWLVEVAEAIIRNRSFSVVRNDPFAGGHVTSTHGRPAEGVHAIQIEVDRAAYCLRDLRTPGPGFDRVAMLFEALIDGLATSLTDRRSEDAE